MKKTLLLGLLLFVSQFSQAQAFSGNGDEKFQVGGNFQNRGTGITASMDFGVAENLSYGFVATYLLNTERINGIKANFEDRADVKVRINANIGNILGLGDAVDFYPGLHLGTRNFGGHLGFRYFFSEGFGLYSEASTPLAKYKNNPVGFDHLNNQFVFNFGAVFNF